MNNYNLILENLYFEKYNERLSVKEIIDLWEDLVQQCEDGYRYTIFELDNELYIRDRIEFLLENSALAKFEDHKIFASRINELDHRLKVVSFNIKDFSEKNWWNSITLKSAYEQYWENVKLYKGIEIKKLAD